MIPSIILPASAFCLNAILISLLRKRKEEFVAAEDLHRSYALVIDIGSSSIRCSPFTIANADRGDIKLVETCVIKMPLKLQDVCNSYWCSEVNPSIYVMTVVDDAIDQCIKSLRIQFKKTRDIRYIGVSSFAMNILGLDSGDNPITPLFTYAVTKSKASPNACDAQHIPTKEELQVHFSKTGTILNHQSYAVSQLRDFICEKSAAALSVKRWTTLSSLFISRWTLLETPVSYSEASWMGLLDFSSLTYDPSAVSLSHVDPRSLPALCDFNQIPVRLLPRLNLILYPELRNVRFFAGIGDGAAANIGSSCEDSKNVCVTIGTSAAARVVIKHSKGDTQVVPPAGLFCYRLDSDRLLLGGALTDGGSLLDWYQGFLGVGAFKAALRYVDRVYSDLTYVSMAPVSVLPFWSGERSTGWHKHATGTISNLDHGSTVGSVLMGIMEGLAYRLSVIIAAMKHSRLIAPPPHTCLVSSGTALESSSALKQMLANMSGYDVVTLRSDRRGEATSYGIAKLIARTLDHEDRGRESSAASLVVDGAVKRSSSHIPQTEPDRDEEDRLWGFRRSEVLSVIRPHSGALQRKYVEKRKIENAELYSRMYPEEVKDGVPDGGNCNCANDATDGAASSSYSSLS
jgi:gluconokinase